MNSNLQNGYLEIFIGPMWSGKTSELFKIYKRYNLSDIPILAINYSTDVRDTLHPTITNHDKMNMNCECGLLLSDISDIINGNCSDSFKKANIILINECQFFQDAVQWVICAVETYNKTVYICGLDGDYKREEFYNWLRLVPFCDKITKLHSVCCGCKKHKAIFTHRTTNESKQLQLGENYEPLCRECYINKNYDIRK